MTPTPDVLRLPLLGSFLRWRYSRFVLQLPLLLLAALSVYDGLTGRQIASINTATVTVWVQYRALAVLALALLGNLFCAACPIMLTRGPSKLLGRVLPTLSWPRALRGKWLTLGLTVMFLFSYEAFDLWASPWLTAWLVVGYFGAALLTDSLFPAGTFCKYVCPLGNFHFALSRAAPTQITARDPGVCRSCESKACLNGRAAESTFEGLPGLPLLSSPLLSGPATLPGCETRLFVPAMRSAQDCTLCLNCLRACPHDNVALAVRAPTYEAETARPRFDAALLLTVLAWGGLLNAYAMVPAYGHLAANLSNLLYTRNEVLLLLLIQGGWLLGGVGLTVLVARAAGGTLREWAVILAPLAVAIWGGHALYHFLIGAGTFWPVALGALARLKLPIHPPEPYAVLRLDAAFPFQVALTYLALGAGAYAAWRRARAQGRATRAVPATLLCVLFASLTLWIFAQPMQARGSLLDAPICQSGAVCGRR